MQNQKLTIPNGFEAFVEDLLEQITDVEGFLSANESRFLALLAAVPTTQGEILEIGSFKGRSTVILARSSELAGDAFINAVDPMNAPSETDPSLGGDTSSYPDFKKNLERHGVTERVRHHKMLSTELAGTWDRPLRLLWIDGDHTHKGTKLDLDSFLPFLSDGAIVAMHDVLHEFEGGIRVFLEDMVLSKHFGAGGLCGSIGWAQYHKDPNHAEQFYDSKIELYRKASRLVPFVALDRHVSGFQKKVYKFYRSRVPHGPVEPARWIEQLTRK